MYVFRLPVRTASDRPPEMQRKMLRQVCHQAWHLALRLRTGVSRPTCPVTTLIPERRRVWATVCNGIWRLVSRSAHRPTFAALNGPSQHC